MSSNNIPTELLIKIKATHFNYMNKNHVFYTENAVKKGAKSWVKPFNKPQLVGHNEKGDPIGRIIDYKIIKGTDTPSNEPSDYVQITARITDEDSIAKIIDGRYLTVSVGSESCRVICSECDQVITEDGLCEHKKGTYNENGEPIYWLIDQIGYTEDSFVNVPADEFAQIEEIMINGEWVAYTKFSDNRESYLSVFILEDTMDDKGTKLTAAQREKLPVNGFCGPNRSFPAHDKAHVLAGLQLLGTAKLSDDAKAKIKSSLYRKGKIFGITPQKDEVGENFDLLYRMEDDFADTEVAELDAWFKENPDSDLPAAKTADTKSTDAVPEASDKPERELSEMDKDQLQDEVKRLQKELEDEKTESKKAIEVRDTKIGELEDKVQKAETIAYEKEDSLNKYVDKTCVLEKKYRDSIISNVIDLKLTDNNNEEREELAKKFVSRTLESLEDSLNDLRNSKSEKPINSEGGVADPTQNLNDNKTSAPKTDGADSEENGDPKFKIFSVDRRKTEADQ